MSAPSGIDDGAIIGKGARFSGAGAIAVPPSSSLAIAAGGSFTFSAWVKIDAPQTRGGLYTRRDGASGLVIGVDQGVPFAEIAGGTPARVSGTQAIAKGAWTHIAVTADGRTLTLYINGRSVGSAPGSLPALNTVTALAGEAPNSTPVGAPATSFIGEMDEVRISKIARPAAAILADVTSQGPDQHLVVFGADEKQAGFSFGYFGIIVKSVTIDAWVVISILGIMAVMSWFVMFAKATYVGGVDRGNDAFLDLFRKRGGDPLAIDEAAAQRGGLRRKLGNSSIYRIYRAGADEMQRRAAHGGQLTLSAEGIEVIRALMDATLVRENQKLARNMVLLTISISGGPFLGLLGTVVGVMITFAAIAASGDVNVNAIAPGISAALLATVTGLAVAIPALFGYNYLIIRNKNVTANMQVFVDEFVTRLAELYSGSGRAHARAAE